MHKVFALCLLMMSLPLMAQENLDFNAGTFLKEGETKGFVLDQEPILVFGENVSEKPAVQAPTFEPTPPSWRGKEATITVKTPFGQTFSVPYINHIPYFFVNVQILSNGETQVTENIQWIVTPQTNQKTFKRTYDAQITTPTGAPWNIERTFTTATHNGKETPIKVDNQDHIVTVTFPESAQLKEGLHTFTVSYIVPDAFLNTAQGGQFFLPLSGRFISVPIERMNILLSAPDTTQNIAGKLVFGDNNFVADDVFESAKDTDGRIAFKTTKLLPPQTDVRLSASMNSLPNISLPFSAQLEQFMLSTLTFWIVLAAGLLIIGYYGVEIILSRHLDNNKKFWAKMMKRLSFTPEMMRYALFKTADARTARAIVLGLISRGNLIVDKKGNILRGKETVALRPTETFVIKTLVAGKPFQAMPFQNNTLFRRLVQQSFIRQFARLTRQELWSGWVLAIVAICLLMILQTPLLKLIASAFILFVFICIGTILFVKKSAYFRQIRKAYDNYASYLNNNIDNVDLLTKNASIVLALDMARRTSNKAVIALPIEGKTTTLHLDELEKIV